MVSRPCFVNIYMCAWSTLPMWFCLLRPTIFTWVTQVTLRRRMMSKRGSSNIEHEQPDVQNDPSEFAFSSSLSLEKMWVVYFCCCRIVYLDLVHMIWLMALSQQLRRHNVSYIFLNEPFQTATSGGIFEREELGSIPLAKERPTCDDRRSWRSIRMFVSMDLFEVFHTITRFGIDAPLVFKTETA